MARLAGQDRGEQSVGRERRITSDLKSTVFGRRHANRTVLSLESTMENPYQTGSAQRVDGATDLRLRGWKLAWLISYVSPFFFQFSFLLLFGGNETSGAASALLIFGPLGIGLLCAIAAVMFSRLPMWQTALGIVATILLFITGLIVFAILVALTLRVEAT